ncbi:GntR family transcriptional regulator [Microvirga antarctica]|uniref:GntR family transcriptional regulator n=1 Tax=Microvirga antarctica TaxID=2819233 RepID=UPI001B301140|nr:GntR family transcriptional regulator [Microvirga antarctica]
MVSLVNSEGESDSVLRTNVVAQSLSDKVVDILIEAIERGELAPGARIREASIARQLGISRGPLREALSRLAGRKLVEYTPNLGMRVVVTSTDDIREIFQIREVLEGAATRLATENMSEADLVDLAALLEKHRHGTELQVGSAYYQRAGDLDFHFRIAQASGNARLVDLLCRDLYHFLRIHRFRASSSPGRAAIAFDEHRAIVAAMTTRDAHLAETLMRQHIRGALERLSAD